MADRLGQQFGNYRLVSLLGQGGYAEVYLGQHVRLDLQAAIKVLHTHLTGSEAEHFQQEAQTIAKLAHPAIVRVFDFDVQDGTPFLVMDYAPNGSLRQRYPKGSLVPIPQILSFVKQMSAALQYAHDKKFIHRDVKPENMLIGQQQEVLLSDFGIATIAHSTSSLNIGSEGTSGTLAYMAPEQIEGHPRPASDQYALGVVVYEWLCGERPFEGSASELIAQHLSMPPLPLHERMPTIPVEIEQVVLRALAKDPKARFASVAAFSAALEHACQFAHTPTKQLSKDQPAFGSVAATGYDTVLVEPGRSKQQTESTPSADQPVSDLEPTVYSEAAASNGRDTPQSGVTSEKPQPDQQVAPTASVVSPPLKPTMPVQRKARHLSRKSAALLIGLVMVIIAGGVLGSMSLLAHFGEIRARSSANSVSPIRGGTWTTDFYYEPGFIPDTNTSDQGSIMAQQALYLPLFYGDAHGMVHPGAATVIPTVQNGGVSADATTWTFHLKQPYAPFLALWTDGYNAPLPAHHFSSMNPEAILKSADMGNPKVTSGPFMMAESMPGDHYTLVRNPRYYRASEGLPYLDKVIIHIATTTKATLKDLQAGSIDSYDSFNNPDVSMNPHAFQRFNQYTLVSSPTSAFFLGLLFNFENTVLATHVEVREAMAIDHQALIAVVHGFGEPICTDHGSFYHPGYEGYGDCPPFDPAAANKLLDDSGWVKGPDGVRTKGKQRLEFELSTRDDQPVRIANEVIVQHNLSVIGIKLDIQNYGLAIFFGSFVGRQASPPTGAVADRNDMAEFAIGPNNQDPDDSELLSCVQYPRYCNPALDALYKHERETVDPGLRQGIFSQIHEIYLTEFPFIALYFPLDVAVVRKGTHNYQPSPFIGETVNIWEWWCDGGEVLGENENINCRITYISFVVILIRNNDLFGLESKYFGGQRATIKAHPTTLHPPSPLLL